MPRPRRVPTSSLLQLLALLAGCAGPRLPLTSAELEARPGRAELLAFLTQADAPADACARVAAALPEAEVRRLPGALTGGLLDGTVPADGYAGCAASLWDVLPAPVAVDLAGRALDAVVELLREPRLAEFPKRQAELAGAARAYVERPAEVRVEEAQRKRALGALDRAARGQPASAITGEAVARLAEALRVEGGTWAGRPLDGMALAAMGGAGDEPALARVARRLPDAGLRAEAERQLVRVRIARSPFPEVRADAAAVEERVLAAGVNPVDLGGHAPVEVRLAPTLLRLRELHVVQRLEPGKPGAGGARLLGLAPGASSPTVLPALPLRGALQLRLAGLAAPVTLCAPGRALDPAPCLPTVEVSAGPGLARVERGVLRLVDSLPAGEVADLARSGGALQASLRVRGVDVADLAWPLRFDAPGDLVLVGSSLGRDGPDLDVRVEWLDPWRLVYAVTPAGGATVTAVVEWEDAGRFHVVTRGARGSSGFTGMDGTDGMDGTSGHSASCPGFPATDGQRGADGGDGSAGGDGGPGRRRRRGAGARVGAARGAGRDARGGPRGRSQRRRAGRRRRPRRAWRPRWRGRARRLGHELHRPGGSYDVSAGRLLRDARERRAGRAGGLAGAGRPGRTRDGGARTPAREWLAGHRSSLRL